MASRDRAAAHRQPARHDDHRRDAIAGARVLARRRDPLRPQHRGRRAGGRARARRPAALRDVAALGQRRSGGRARGPAEGAVHRLAADGGAWAAAATRGWPRGSPRRWRPSCAPWASRSTTRRCSTSTPTRRTRSSATGRCRRTPSMVARLGAAIIRGLQEHGVAACGKHFPGHGDTSVDSHLELPLVEHPPDRIRRVECVPFRAAIAAGRGVHHDRARPGAVARREAPGHAVARDRLRPAARGAGVRGRDPERRPRDEGDRRHLQRAGCGGAGHGRRLRRPARVQRTAGGAGAPCSRRWCTPSRQDIVPLTRLEDALKRLRRAKERAARAFRWRVATARSARGRRWAATRTGAWPTRWRAFADDESRGRSGRATGSASWRRPAAARPRSWSGGVAELRRLGFEPVYTTALSSRDLFSAGPALTRARDFMASLDRPVDRRPDRAAGRLRQRTAPAAPRRHLRSSRRRSSSSATATPPPCSPGSRVTCGVPALHGPMIEARLSRGPEGYDEASFLALRARRDGHRAALRRPASCLAAGEARGPLFGGTLTQLVGVARHALRVHAAGRLPAVHRGRERAAVSPAPAC